MSEQHFDIPLDEMGVPQFVDSARHASLVRSISRSPGSSGLQARAHRLPRLAFLYETRGLLRFRESERKRPQADGAAYTADFQKAFDCWRALVTLPEEEIAQTPAQVSEAGLAMLKFELGTSVLPDELYLSFHLAVTGLLAQSAAEARLELRRFTFDELVSYTSWRDAVVEHVFCAFVLLVRKDKGWADIDDALKRISRLRDLQHQYEETYLNSQGPTSDQAIAAVELVGLYHLAQITTMVGEYLATGKETAAQTFVRLDRHHDRAREAFESLRQTQLQDLADMFWAGCRTLIQNCIWTHVAGLPESVKSFAKALTERGRPNPVIELWPSQQEALRKNLLDTYPRAILVEMPTSAGKTLLAKFAIVQTFALSPNGTIVYVVPTRALVNQVTLELRGDFRDLKPRIRVEQTVPVFEIDPTEARLLEDPPNVLVTTPEKLDLLVRSDHPSVANISLVIADEAHNIGSKGRGARLELLLGTLKRDRDSARFLLLSPFLPNDRELLTWLGDERALPPIQVDWKPSNRIVGAIRKNKIRGTDRYAVRFRTLAAADNADVPEGLDVDLGISSSKKASTKALSADAVRLLRDRGSLLILCRGRGTAATRAEELSGDRDELRSEPLLEAACRYLEAEVGRETSLVRCLRRGVAYHHAGMSQEAKGLVEALMRRNIISIVCGTTTLAQGVNFPISSVIVETLAKGDDTLTYQDFWNIAGRAGRTLVDTLGLVVFTSQQKSEVEQFLRAEATEVSSQLTSLISRVDEIGDKFNFVALRKIPELSALLQFLAHAMRVSGTSDLADEVEDLLRASLVYHQARKESAGSAKILVNLCRAYIASLEGRKDILKLADTTGFSTPSVLKLLVDKSDRAGFTNLNDWKPENLFGSNLAPLVDRVAAISELPEMKLGEGDGTPFDPNLVARIIRDWVSGETLDRLASKHWQSREKDPDKRLNLFSTYLFSTLLGQVSWGLGALEGVCLSGRDEDLEAVGHIPSMVFFGVRKKPAVWLRMVGVPRIVADDLATLWMNDKKSEPRSHDEIREWVSNLSGDSWQQVIPKHSRLRPVDMKVLWDQFCA
jgi:hypothetical protein